MAILAVLYASFVEAGIARRQRGWIWAWGAVVLVVIGGTATLLVQKAWGDSEDIPVLREAIAHDQGFEGTDEYDPVGDDHYNLPEKAPRGQDLPAGGSEGGAPQAEMQIGRWSAGEKNSLV